VFHSRYGCTHSKKKQHRYYGGATGSRQKIRGAGSGNLRYTLSQKHKSTNLHNTETKINVMISHLRYQYHCQFQCHCCLYQSLVTCTNTQHVGDLKWVCVCDTGIVLSSSIARVRIATLPSRPSTSGDLLWRAHSTFVKSTRH
jgi:hypothetical protein